MKVLAFVDTHGSERALKALKTLSRQADLLLCAGDFTIFEQDLDKVLKRIDSWGKPTLIIHGNHEMEQDLEKACKKLQNVEFFHKKAKIINNILFIGYGGGGFEKKTPELAAFFKSQEFLLKSCQKKVFMFHAPPLDTKLDLIGSRHNGSQTEKELILKYEPYMVVCGHFHENAGKSERVGKGLLINPGPAGWLLKL